MGFQSLYVGATGLAVHGQKMNVIGNNLANVTTIGFKGSEALFQNMLSETIASGNSSGTNSNQVGMGASIATIQGDFHQGAIEPGTYATDMAIGGKGYFRVVQDDLVHYTRAGNFRFDNAGYLVDPNGFRLQGQAITTEGNEGTADLQLDLNEDNQLVIEGSATTLATVAMNLGDETDNRSSATDPFFALMQSWDGTTDTPLSEGAYDYMNTLTVYDDQGEAHALNLYFDSVGVDDGTGNRYIEFVAGMDPADDGRADFEGTSGAGLLMAGVLTFNSAGQFVDMAAYTRSDTASAGSGVKSLSAWVPATLGEDGVPVIEAECAAASGATAGVLSMGLDLGLTASSETWASGSASNASVVGTTASNLAAMDSPERAALATTAYVGSSSTLYQTQDGYGEGTLKNLSVDRTGVINGTFSNGVVKELFQVTLYTFPSEYNLRREGMNHFSETLASGAAVEGLPDHEQFGYIMGESLEQSNVDMAKQFTSMILAERGFQANSKIITTSDALLQTLIQIKR